MPYIRSTSSCTSLLSNFSVIMLVGRCVSTSKLTRVSARIAIRRWKIMTEFASVWAVLQRVNHVSGLVSYNCIHKTHSVQVACENDCGTTALRGLGTATHAACWHSHIRHARTVAQQLLVLEMRKYDARLAVGVTGDTICVHSTCVCCRLDQYFKMRVTLLCGERNEWCIRNMLLLALSPWAQPGIPYSSTSCVSHASRSACLNSIQRRTLEAGLCITSLMYLQSHAQFSCCLPAWDRPLVCWTFLRLFFFNERLPAKRQPCWVFFFSFRSLSLACPKN